MDQQQSAALDVIDALELRLRETFADHVPDDLMLLLHRLEATVSAHGD